MQPDLAVLRLLYRPIKVKVSQNVSKNKNALNSAASADSKPKRRWLNIGPGIVVALAVSALIGSQWIKTEMAARQQRSAPPIVERQVISSSYEEKSGPTPEVSFIIERADKLHITNSQLAHLETLRAEWRKFYGHKMADANQAADRTSKYLADARNKSRTPVAQIQNAAAPVIALSGEISSARRSYWDRAISILSPEQRKALQAEREAVWAMRKGAPANSRQRAVTDQ